MKRRPSAFLSLSPQVRFSFSRVSKPAPLVGRLARHTSGTPQRICTGSTPIGSSAWESNGGSAVDLILRVDTSACNFTARPLYVSSLVGENHHALATGGSAPYVLEATARTGFSIYLGNATTPANANADKWHIEWIGIGQ
jgi:hypothetical protein